MSDEDRKYLRFVKKLRPSIDVFGRLVQILTKVQDETNRILKNSSLGKA